MQKKAEYYACHIRLVPDKNKPESLTKTSEQVSSEPVEKKAPAVGSRNQPLKVSPCSPKIWFYLSEIKDDTNDNGSKKQKKNGQQPAGAVEKQQQDKNDIHDIKISCNKTGNQSFGKPFSRQQRF
jgi:hypothetical protein